MHVSKCKISLTISHVRIQVDEIIVLEPEEVEWVAGPAPDPAEAGGQAEQGPQAGWVGGIDRLTAQPHRNKDNNRLPLRVS